MTIEEAGRLLPAADMAAAVRGYFTAVAQARTWTVEDRDFPWHHADAGRLTEGQRSAVEFVTVIEDHLPGYFAVYTEHFPADGSVDPAVFEHNRELYHFTVRWAAEEDTHARALARYQEASGLASADALRRALVVPGRQPFDLPYDHPVQFFAYALVQEKATQIYYRQLRDVVADPVLGALLTRLARDEARHFAFMADVVTRYLRSAGEDVVDPVRDVVATFRMPLADTLRGYWRWALRIADTARYDHTDAYEHLIRVIERAVDAPTDRHDELVRFIAACRTVGA